MKILFFEINSAQVEYFRNSLNNDTLIFYETPLLNQVIKEPSVQIISIFVYSLITKNVLDMLPDLSLIITRSVGTEHIDMQECKKRNITIINLPTYCTTAVAEYTFALILSLSRKLYQTTIQSKHECIQGFDLRGKTLGVVGTGAIGKKVIQIAQGFSLYIIAHDIQPDQSFAEAMNVRYLDLTTLLATADIITLHVALTETTRNLINEKNSIYIKQGALLINTARGDIIQQDVLIKGLHKNIFTGIALDVLPSEYLTQQALRNTECKITDEQLAIIKNNLYLIHHPNVIVTPHNAYNSHESIEKLVQETVSIIEHWKKNRN